MHDALRYLTRCTEEGDCLIWPGWVNSTGQPAIGHSKRSLRRVIFEHYRWDDERLPDNLLVRMQCGVRRCLNPEHMTLREKADMMAEINRGPMSPMRIANMTKARRQRSGHSMALARAVRADLAHMTTREAAKKHGVSQSTVSKIGRGEIWRESVCPGSSVFAFAGSIV